MADSVAGLFGLSPEELQVQLRNEALARQQLRSQEIGTYGAGLGPFQSVVQANARLGDALGNIAQGMFGGAPQQDPRMTRALALQDITKAYGGQDLTDPTVMKSLIGDLQQGGFTKEAFSLLGSYDALRKKGQAKTSETFTDMNGGPIQERVNQTTGFVEYYDAKGKKLEPNQMKYKPTGSSGLQLPPLPVKGEPAAAATPATPAKPLSETAGKYKGGGQTTTTPAAPAAQAAAPTAAPRSKEEVDVMIKNARNGYGPARKYLEDAIASGELSVGQRQAAEAALAGR